MTDHAVSPLLPIVVVFGLYALVGLIGLAIMAFWIIELVDCLRRDFRDPSEKIVWVLVIIFTHFVGALLYWIMGKSHGTLPPPAE